MWMCNTYINTVNVYLYTENDIISYTLYVYNIIIIN